MRHRFVEGQTPAGGGGYDPTADTPNLQGFYDFSNTSSLTLAGSDITTINDLSANAYHLTAIGTKATTVAAAQNGLAVGRFATTVMQTAANHTLNQPATICIALKSTNASAEQGIVTDTRSGSGSNRYMLRTLATDAWDLFWSNEAITSGAVRDTSWHVITCVIQADNTLLRIDGTQVAHAFAFQSGATASSGLFVLGGAFFDALYFEGDIGQVVISGNYLTGTDLTDLEDATATKWGI